MALISMAVSSCSNPEVLDCIDGDDTVWEREPLERLAHENQLSSAYKYDGFWQNMDTLRDKNVLEIVFGPKATRHGKSGIGSEATADLQTEI